MPLKANIKKRLPLEKRLHKDTASIGEKTVGPGAEKPPGGVPFHGRPRVKPAIMPQLPEVL